MVLTVLFIFTLLLFVADKIFFTLELHEIIKIDVQIFYVPNFFFNHVLRRGALFDCT